MATSEILTFPTAEVEAKPAYLILDTESVPDGRLVGLIKYSHEKLTPEEAIARAQREAREHSANGSDFLPVSFQFPVAICVVRVGADYEIQRITCLDAPHFRPAKMVEQFWQGLGRHKTKLVTFNGRCFDLPLLELAAFRYGCRAVEHFGSFRHRYSGHFDLLDWLSNYGAYRLVGGLDLLSKVLGKPGKMELSGEQVYGYYQAGRLQEINDYCMFDTIDTYFVFLRTRVLTGDLTLEREHELVQRAKLFLHARVTELPALRRYLDNWGDWRPWP